MASRPLNLKHLRYFAEVARGGSRGSHFFTAQPADQLILSGLNPANQPQPVKPFLEGVEGYTVLPDGSSKCPSGTAPIYRAFKGPPRYVDDGNHRFSTSLAQHQDMVTRLGWADEGVAFCAVEIWRGRSVTSYGGPGQVETRRSSGIMPRRTYWAVGASMCYIGAEFCISLWGVQLIEERAGLSAAAASAGLGTFLGGLFVFLGGTPAGQDATKAPTNHSPRFSIDEKALKLGVRTLLHMTTDYLGAR